VQLPALRDGLRGLYNRRYLEDVFSRELHRVERNGKPVSVVMIISAPPTPPAAMAAKSLPSVGGRVCVAGESPPAGT